MTKDNRDWFSAELQIVKYLACQNPNQVSVLHPSCMAKTCPFLLTIPPPVDYRGILCGFFFPQSNQHLYLVNTSKLCPWTHRNILKFSNPTSLNRH